MPDLDMVPINTLTPQLPADTPDIVRKIAAAIEIQGQRNLYAESLGKSVAYTDYLAIMLWDLVTGGEALFADGTPLAILDHKEWLATLKFIAGHVEGVARPDTSGGMNIYKIYMGVDMDRV